MDEFTYYSTGIQQYQFVVPPKANVRLSFGERTATYFEYYMENIPNRFQRWLLLKVFGIKLEKL